MMSSPAVVDVFKECWVEDLDLVFIYSEELLHWSVSKSNLARGQSAGDPDQIQCFEGNEHEADVGCQVFGALWVHEVVSGVAARVFLVAHCGGQIYPRRECDGVTE